MQLKGSHGHVLGKGVYSSDLNDRKLILTPSGGWGGSWGARFARRQGCSCQMSDVKPGIGLCGLAWIGEGRLGNTRCKIGRTGENWLGVGYGEFKDFRADRGKNRIMRWHCGTTWAALGWDCMRGDCP